MSEELFVNIATEVQQPYIARVPVNAQQPNIRTMEVQGPASGRQPSTYQYRSPFIYNNPVSAQEPNIREARQPAIYQYRSPFTYQNPSNARQPATYQHRSPFTYQNPVNAQEPNIRDAQQPYPYIANGQYVAQTQQPYTYPYIANRQNTAQQPASYRHPVIANRQTTIDNANPSIANRQTAVDATYQVIAQQPAIQWRSDRHRQRPAGHAAPVRALRRDHSDGTFDVDDASSNGGVVLDVDVVVGQVNDGAWFVVSLVPIWVGVDIVIWVVGSWS